MPLGCPLATGTSNRGYSKHSILIDDASGVKIGLIVVDLEFLQDTDIWQFSAPFSDESPNIVLLYKELLSLKFASSPDHFSTSLTIKAHKIRSNAPEWLKVIFPSLFFTKVDVKHELALRISRLISES